MPRFVILEHNWNGVHWDWMFEDGDSLATWAVDEPPTPTLDAPARALPAHRSIYLDYEGPISGDRGTVRRVDRGEYRTIRRDDDGWVVELGGDQIRGAVWVRRMRGEGDMAGPPGWRITLGKVD